MFQIVGVPTTTLIVLLLAFGIGVFILSLLALSLFSRLLRAGVIAAPVAPFFVSITTVWALTLGFIGADVWSMNNQAEYAANAERSAIGRLLGMATPEALDLPALGAAVNAYQAMVVQDEWGRGANRVAAVSVEAALRSIHLVIIAAAKADLPPTLGYKLITAFDALQDARNLRLAIGGGILSPYKRYLLVFLTVLAHLAIALVHADRPKAGWPALAIFAMASTASLLVLALHADPYGGVLDLTADRLRHEQDARLGFD